MECRINKPIDRHVVEVILFERREGETWVRVYDQGHVTHVRVPTLARMPISIEFEPEDFKALIEAGSDFEPPSSAQGRHLDDAIKVRDRLLTLVEQS